MPYINRHSIAQLSKDTSEKANLTSSTFTLSNDLNTIMENLSSHLLSSKVEKTCNWLLYNDTWLDNELGQLNPPFYNYSRGDIILSVDFGTSNIGTEIRYPHPAVVLYDNDEDWVICAPITACQIDRLTKKPVIHAPFEVFVPAQKKSPSNPKEFQFKKDSVIQVDQIIRISKFRAVNKTTLKVRADILNQIDNVILENYIPFKHKLLEKMKHINKTLNAELDIKNQEITSLTKQVQDLQQELEALKTSSKQNNSSPE